jgi:hypothetical protein
MFKSIFKCALISRCVVIFHDAEAIWSILGKISFVKGSISIIYCTFTFFHPIFVKSHKTIPIIMNNLSISVHYPFLPYSIYFYLSCSYIINSFTMPKIVLPFTLINLASASIIIHTLTMFHLINKGTFVAISISIKISSLNEI